jgi:hypothetical protein
MVTTKAYRFSGAAYWQLMGSTAASPQLNLRMARLGNSFLSSIMSSDEEDYMSMVIEEPKQKETFTQRKKREQREVSFPRSFFGPH